MNKVFYEKRGNKYYPVSEYSNEVCESFREGAHLVVCKPGSKLGVYRIDPAFAPMLAAGLYAKDRMCMALVNASQLKPEKQPLTQEQRDAWDALAKAFGKERFTLQRDATCDIVEAGLAAMRSEADKLLTNPAVKKAYEHFMMLCKLTKENQNEN